MSRVQVGSVVVVCLALATGAIAAPVVYPPHATVEGRTLADWSAVWWQSVFALPVYAADGTTVTHPQFDTGLQPTDTVDAPHALPSPDGRVTFLYGTFFGGSITRDVTVPANKPIFVPIINSEWSNADTGAAPEYTDIPGNLTPAELAAFAKQQTDSITDVAVTLDGTAVPDMLSHRETATAFEWTEPAEHSITQSFFNYQPDGPVASSADGYYLMIDNLDPGTHTLHFTGSSPDNSATPPLLGAFNIDMTYNITVQGAAAIPLPAGVWAGLTVLPLALAPWRKRRRGA
jgi:hypothetical protein